jgi:hypothetical protein
LADLEHIAREKTLRWGIYHPIEGNKPASLLARTCRATQSRQRRQASRLRLVYSPLESALRSNNPNIPLYGGVSAPADGVVDYREQLSFVFLKRKIFFYCVKRSLFIFRNKINVLLTEYCDS